MKITCDWHIHTHNSCDEASLLIKDLLVEAKEKNILDFGITDHIHTPYNFPDIEASKKEFFSNNPPIRAHFGVEVSCVSQWELDEVAKGKYETPVYGIRKGGPAGTKLAVGITSADIERYNIEYVIGGTHWPMYEPIEREEMIRSYHRQNMFLATHPLITIVAHPWWWMGAWQGEDGMYRKEPWFDDFTRIPKSMHNEFAKAVMQNNKVVEINLGAILLTNKYPENFKKNYLNYIAFLKEYGVKLSVGSDCHSEHYVSNFEEGAKMLDLIGIKDADLWRLPPRKK